MEKIEARIRKNVRLVVLALTLSPGRLIGREGGSDGLVKRSVTAARPAGMC